MIYVFMTVNKGIISKVLFYYDEKEALKALNQHVRDRPVKKSLRQAS